MRVSEVMLVLLGGCNQVLGVHHTRLVDAGITCPAGYTHDLTTGLTYKVMPSGPAQRFDSAKKACNADEAVGPITGHTHLVVIGNDAERAVIAAQLNNATAWVGLTHRLHGEFAPPYDGPYRWITDEAAPTDAYWDANQPNQPTLYACVVMDGNGKLETFGCDMSDEAYVCECDEYAYDPASN